MSHNNNNTRHRHLPRRYDEKDETSHPVALLFGLATGSVTDRELNEYPIVKRMKLLETLYPDKTFSIFTVNEDLFRAGGDIQAQLAKGFELTKAELN